MEKKIKLTYADKILIVIFLALSVFLAIFVFRIGNSNADKYISVQVDGKEVEKYSFSSEEVGKKHYIRTNWGYNIMEIDEGRVRVTDSDSPYKLVVKQGWISKPGEILVCLPHRLVVEIKSTIEDSSEIDNLSY